MSELRDQRLLVHRELQFLRAGAWRPRKGQQRRKRRWVAERARKLEQARARVRT